MALDRDWLHVDCANRPNELESRISNPESRVPSAVVLLIHPALEQPAAERTQPAKNVIHVSKVHQLDQIAVEIPAEEKGVAAGRALGAADDLHAFAGEIVVPALQVADVEREVRQADAVPRNRHGRLL